MARLLKRRNVTQKFVDRASRIEQQNAIFQRNFYRLYKLRRGTFHSLETQALRLVNNTRNKYIRMTPNEAVAAADADIAPRYNTAREQSEEEYHAVTIDQGDRVRHLRNIRKRIRGIGYKAYGATTGPRRCGTSWRRSGSAPPSSTSSPASGTTATPCCSCPPSTPPPMRL